MMLRLIREALSSSTQIMAYDDVIDITVRKNSLHADLWATNIVMKAKRNTWKQRQHKKTKNNDTK